MESFCLEKGSISITLICNLKHARCSSNILYRKSAQHTSLADIQEHLGRCLKIAGYVKKFTTVDREDLSYSEVPSAIRTLSQYMRQVGITEIGTNGIVAPGRELISAVKARKDNVESLRMALGDQA